MPPDAPTDLQIEIAAGAARLIAEEGCDYATAKRKAAIDVLGEGASARRTMPDNQLVEAELRRYLQTFGGADHDALLAALRGIALALMERFARFNPHLVGAVLNGTATGHSDIHLHLFSDSAKDIEMQLLDEGVDFDVGEGGAEPGTASETLHFVVAAPPGTPLPRRIGVVLSAHPTDAIRVAPRNRSMATDLHPVAAAGRANQAALRQLLSDQPPGTAA